MRLARHVDHYIWLAEKYLQDKPYDRHDIELGRDAWNVAHRASITNHAYALGRDITDGHIQTALKSVFPNVQFKDKATH